MPRPYELRIGWVGARNQARVHPIRQRVWRGWVGVRKWAVVRPIVWRRAGGLPFGMGVWSNSSKRTVATVGIVLLLFLPVMRNRDGLPLSTYPMYSSARSDTVRFVTVRAFDSRDNERSLSMFTIAETRDPLIAESYLSDVVDRGDAAQLCQDVAARVGPEVRRIEVARERFELTDRQTGDPAAERDVITSCESSP